MRGGLHNHKPSRRDAYGAALTVTLNIPYTQIENAAVSVGNAGCGNIALETKGLLNFRIWCCGRIRSWKISKAGQP